MINGQSNIPTFTGTSNEALHEIHIFLSDLNPSSDILNKYNRAVEEWNDTHKDLIYQMKSCFLALVFRDSNGIDSVVKVMQSARHIKSNDSSYVIQQCHDDAAWFTNRGLPVVREKIEAMAYGIKEIPLNSIPEGKYFEFHIKVGRKDREKVCPIESSEIDELKSISQKFSHQFKIPVPLSYNENKNQFNQDGEGHQRFLNVRFRKGRDECMKYVSLVKEAIDTQSAFNVLKVISEYVWFDTYTDMDKGWIDYTQEELHKMYGTQ
jgi:hypothetical protein